MAWNPAFTGWVVVTTPSWYFFLSVVGNLYLSWDNLNGLAMPFGNFMTFNPMYFILITTVIIRQGLAVRIKYFALYTAWALHRSFRQNALRILQHYSHHHSIPQFIYTSWWNNVCSISKKHLPRFQVDRSTSLNSKVSRLQSAYSYAPSGGLREYVCIHPGINIAAAPLSLFFLLFIPYPPQKDVNTFYRTKRIPGRSFCLIVELFLNPKFVAALAWSLAYPKYLGDQSIRQHPNFS